MHIQYTEVDAPHGSIFLGETRDGLVYVGLGPDGLNRLTLFAQRWFSDVQIVPSMVDAKLPLTEYMAGQRKTFDLPLVMMGTDFQKSVWRALLDIPYGETRSYGHIASALGRPGAARAVGRACGANPLPIIVPCHRVLASDGSPGGYTGGPEWKHWLLKLEGALD